jgi:hypothetical protein
MVEISSPISRENRIQISRSANISGLVGDRSSILSQNPYQVQQTGPDPQTIQLLQTNQSSLNVVSTGLVTLRQRIDNLSNSLSSLSNVVINNSILENYREQQKLQQDRILEQQALRDESEAVIESKISSALVAPVKTVSKKASDTLNSLMGTLSGLFLGWLSLNNIGKISGLISKSFEGLSNIKKGVENSFKFISNIFGNIKGAIDDIITKISNFSNSIVKFVTDNPLVNSIKSLLDKLGLGEGKPPAPAPEPVPPPAQSLTQTASKAGTEAAAEAATKAGTRVETKVGAEAATEVASKAGSKAFRFLPFLNIPISSYFAYQNIKESDPIGAGLNLGGMIPGPLGWLSIAASAGYEWKTDGGIKIKNPFESKPQQPQQPKPQQKVTPASQKPNIPAKPSAQAQPQTPLIAPSQIQSEGEKKAQEVTPSNVSFNFGDQVSNINSKVFPTFNEDQQYTVDMSSVLNMKQPLANGESDTYTMFDKNKPEDLLSSTPQSPTIESVRKPETAVGPLGKSQPNIIIAPVPQSSQPASPQASSPGNDVPAIPSSNPDNFYALYSQVHYNIVV